MKAPPLQSFKTGLDTRQDKTVIKAQIGNCRAAYDHTILATMIMTLLDNPLHWSLVYLILFSATVVQGGVGFGFGLIAAPLLLLIEPSLLPGPLIVAALTLTVTMAVRGWRWIEFAIIPWLLLGFLPGLWLGTTLLQILSPQQTAYLFGSLVLSAVAISAIGWQPE
ncbi:MAG: TSUP family transporter, partial [Magnetococcales bacterium]|nr:TSUP family transporter [Magnetococcales bacterium]